jgi:hypothetical protein
VGSEINGSWPPPGYLGRSTNKFWRNKVIRLITLGILCVSLLAVSANAQSLVQGPTEGGGTLPTNLATGIVTWPLLSDGEYESEVYFRNGNSIQIATLVVNGVATYQMPSELTWDADSDLLVELYDTVTGGFSGYTLFSLPGTNASAGGQPIALWPIVLTPQRRIHILDGDATGGGHGVGRGIPGKSEFLLPDNAVIDDVVSIATDPPLTWVMQPNGNIRIEGYRFPHNITVILEGDGMTVVTAFPTNVPRNPRKSEYECEFGNG